MYFFAHRQTGETLLLEYTGKMIFFFNNMGPLTFSVCVCRLPRDLPKDGDSKADPLTSHHVVLEGRDDGGDEVLDVGKAALAKSPRLIHQKHNVSLHHSFACWRKRGIYK